MCVGIATAVAVAIWIEKRAPQNRHPTPRRVHWVTDSTWWFPAYETARLLPAHHTVDICSGAKLKDISLVRQEADILVYLTAMGDIMGKRAKAHSPKPNVAEYGA